MTDTSMLFGLCNTVGHGAVFPTMRATSYRSRSIVLRTGARRGARTVVLRH
jgi:hypothetical protein